VQAQVVASLAQGHTVTRAATAAGIHRSTIHNWLRASTEFRTALEEARRRFTASIADQLNELSAAALQTLRTLLESPDTPPAVRLKAALAVLERPDGARDPGWQLPECVRLPRLPAAPDHASEPARNAPCPCGSGLKFKRCCGRAASPLPLPAAPAAGGASMLRRPD
jgi:transposase-like protein